MKDIFCAQLSALALSILFTANVNAIPIGGVEFPQGAISFADAVIDYSPVINDSGQPTAANSNSLSSLGAADYAGGGVCTVADACRFSSLGSGGSMTLAFLDNKLTLGGSSDADLWIFEVGADVEDTFVEISIDGSTWFDVGRVFGATSGVDIDSFVGAYGFTTTDLFGFVRLTDDVDEGDQFGASVGPDIDAVGAISTVFTPPTTGVPAPATFALLGLGLAGLGWSRRKKA